MHTNSTTQREHISKEIASSLIVIKESVLVIGVIRTK
jgi:hypothetical protein